MAELVRSRPVSVFGWARLKRTGDRLAVSLPVLMGFNLANRTISVSLSMEKFRELSEVANEARIIELTGDKGGVAQRPLDEKHARSIALYILRGLLHSLKERWEQEGRDIPEELHPLPLGAERGHTRAFSRLRVTSANARWAGTTSKWREWDSGELILHLRQGQLIWVIDGQHRRFGYGLLIEWLGNHVARTVCQEVCDLPSRGT